MRRDASTIKAEAEEFLRQERGLNQHIIAKKYNSKSPSRVGKQEPPHFYNPNNEYSQNRMRSTQGFKNCSQPRSYSSSNETNSFRNTASLWNPKHSSKVLNVNISSNYSGGSDRNSKVGSGQIVDTRKIMNIEFERVGEHKSKEKERSQRINQRFLKSSTYFFENNKPERNNKFEAKRKKKGPKFRDQKSKAEEIFNKKCLQQEEKRIPLMSEESVNRRMANTAYGSFMPICGLTLEKYFTLNRYQTPELDMKRQVLEFEKQAQNREQSKSVTPETFNMRKTQSSFGEKVLSRGQNSERNGNTPTYRTEEEKGHYREQVLDDFEKIKTYESRKAPGQRKFSSHSTSNSIHNRSQDMRSQIPKSYSDVNLGFTKTSVVLPQVSTDVNVTSAPLIAGEQNLERPTSRINQNSLADGSLESRRPQSRSDSGTRRDGSIGKYPQNPQPNNQKSQRFPLMNATQYGGSFVIEEIRESDDSSIGSLVDQGEHDSFVENFAKPKTKLKKEWILPQTGQRGSQKFS